MKRIILIGSLALSLAACKKNDVPNQPGDLNDLKPHYEAKTLFSETLAQTLGSEPLVRKFIKEEALKRFDNDYDVLYFLKKDVVFEDGETFHQKMLKHTSRQLEFEQNLKKYPLMTIYVPELPSFNAKIWNTATQVPVVAIEPDRINRHVNVITADGQTLQIPDNSIPAVPTIVVKENERVILETTDFNARYENLMEGSDLPEFYAEKDGKRFLFLANAFNGNFNSNPTLMRTVPGASLDAKLLTAYTIGNLWQRDYIYYNISPGTPNGAFTNQFSEFVTSFKFLNPNVDFNVAADQDGDPELDTEVFDPPYWVEGAFEFHMDVLINAQNGAGQILAKVFSASGADMVTPTYTSTRLFGSIYIYTLTGFTANEFHPNNLELTAWDLQQYGSVWKFILTEHDPSQTETRTVTNTSKYGSNFGYDISLGTDVKIGPTLTSEVSSTNTFTVTTTLDSDKFGEGLLDFRNPFIVSGPSGPASNYQTYEVTTGTFSFSVEPKRIY